MSNKKKNNPPQLSSKQVKYLRGLGHKISPLVLVGKDGISEGVLEAVMSELSIHELIKVKIGNNSNVTKQEAAQSIPELTHCTLVQLIGKTLLLYKPNPELHKDKRIILPKL